jgi:geranylgeranyl pyrophosphate synthase
MKLANAQTLDTTPLLAMLDDAFGRREPGGPGSHGVPDELWERALRGPLREMLSRPGKEMRARLVQLGFALGGGAPSAMPPELPWLIELFHAGSMIVDDIEDDSDQRRGAPTLHKLHGLPVALNAGNWLYFWPQVLLSRMQLPPAARLDAHERIADCMLRCHEGQALDLTVRIDSLARADVPAVVRTLTTLKTGRLVGLATALGAVAALATSRRTDALARFGCDVGVGLQMLDDLSGVLNPARRDKAEEDLQLGRATFVWALFAELLDAASYAALLEQLRAAQSGDERAQDALLAHARFRLGMTGLRRVRRHFADAVSALERVIEPGGWSAAVRAELAWLERQFLEAP